MHRCTPHINSPYNLEEIDGTPYFSEIAISFLYTLRVYYLYIALRVLFLNENYFWRINRLFNLDEIDRAPYFSEIAK